MIKKLLLGFVLLFAAHSQGQFFEGFQNGDYQPAIGTWTLPSGVWHISDNAVGLGKSWLPNTTIATPPLQWEGSTSASIARELVGVGNTSEDWLVTPAITVNPGDKLGFFNRVYGPNTEATMLQIRISTTSATDHSSFSTVTGWLSQNINSAVNIYEQKIVPLDAFAGQTVYIAFVRMYTQQPGDLHGGEPWVIDQVEVKQYPEAFNFVNGTINFGQTSAACTPLSMDNPWDIYPSMSPGFNTSISNTGAYDFITQDNVFSIGVNLAYPAYFNVTPASYDYNFTEAGHHETADFCITPNGTHNDLEIYSTGYYHRPGHNVTIGIVYANHGTEPQSGTVSFTFDGDKLDLVTTTQPVSSQTANSLSWDFTDLQPMESKYVHAIFYVHSPMDMPPAALGDIVNYTATVTSALVDETPADNTYSFSEYLTDSFDPNDKQVAEGETISISQAQDFLHYVVHFQNTGNAPALNVKVNDPIADNLDLSTLRILGSSHVMRTETANNQLNFVFDNINLPAASVDETGSQGFVAFKIKPKNTVGIGSVLSNTAHIYFDYNYPITTNTVTTTVTALGVGSFNPADSISLYPNPTKNLITIGLRETVEIKDIAVVNLLGQTVKAVVQSTASDAITIDVSSLDAGTYFLQVTTGDGKMTKKFIKL